MIFRSIRHTSVTVLLFFFLLLLFFVTFNEAVATLIHKEAKNEDPSIPVGATGVKEKLRRRRMKHMTTETVFYLTPQSEAEDETIASEDIVGGSAVQNVASYPFFGFSKRGALCAATLIHDDIAVTAGHCAGVFSNSGLLLGGRQLNGLDAKEDITVLKELRHPLYNKITFENDILLLKLQRNRTMNTFVQPVYSINQNRSTPQDNATVTTIGMGRTSENAALASELQQVSIRVINNKICQRKYRKSGSSTNSNNISISDSMICAASLGKDACMGDSGGPLLIQVTDEQQRKRWKLIGIVSWGIGCARVNRPGVYTRISSHIKFIQSGICQLSKYKPSYCQQDSSVVSTPCPISEQCDNGYFMYRRNGGTCVSSCISRMFGLWKGYGYQCGKCN